MPATVPPAAFRRLGLACPTPAAQLALMAVEVRHSALGPERLVARVITVGRCGTWFAPAASHRTDLAVG